MNKYMKRPEVKEALNEALEKTGITMKDLFFRTETGNLSRRKIIVEARRHIIRKLYDPATSGNYGSCCIRRYGLVEIGRILEIDHSSVFYAVKKMGIHPNVRA